MYDKISVIVPVYNVENYLPKCIESIMNQTYSNLEIILVDDGSKDKSGIICDEYKEKDNRIKVIHKENGGLSSARNAGLKISNGSYIGFVDSDDFIEKNMYELLLMNMNEYKSDVSICDIYYNFNGDKTRKNYKNNNNESFVICNKEKFDYMYNEYESLAGFAWNKLYKKELLNDLEFPVGQIFEDMYIMIDIFEKAKKISYILKPLYNYLIRQNGIVKNFTVKHFDCINNSNKYINAFAKKDYFDLVIKEKNKKALIILNNFVKMRYFKIYNDEIFTKYYNELLNTTKELKWQESKSYVKMFKIFKKQYITIRFIEYCVYNVLKNNK